MTPLVNVILRASRMPFIVIVDKAEMSTMHQFSAIIIQDILDI